MIANPLVPTDTQSASVFEHESSVRSYSRVWTAEFSCAHGAWIKSNNGSTYLDLFAGAGALQYGHNPIEAVNSISDYLRRNGILHSLDVRTEARSAFIDAFVQRILRPRDLDYLLQFTGPTGTNAVEASLKLARIVTGRRTIIAFTNSFHGVSQGALSVTADAEKREAASGFLNGVQFLPYDGFLGPDVDTVSLFERMICESGLEKPAAVILETVQGEGGIRVASNDWLNRIGRICRQHDILVIVDDIQAGCGRTGPFFSFESCELLPDIVCLSKGLSGCGLPLALLLIRPTLDIWKPGQHNGTFRGNNLAFVAATACLNAFWATGHLQTRVQELSGFALSKLERWALAVPSSGLIDVRGRGLIIGVEFKERPELARRLQSWAYDHHIIVETRGRIDSVVAVTPPLTISQEELEYGLDRLEIGLKEVSR
jgi:diaminobutyrate-2-oxoglutarate transaminase